MKKTILFLIVVLLIIGCSKEKLIETYNEIELPEPSYESNTSIEKALYERISIRDFEDEELTLKEVSQILWAAQGIDGVSGATRTAPSAGATQPLEIYLIVRKVDGLEPGIYHYNPKKHIIIKKSSKEFDLYYNAPVYLIITAVYRRTTDRYRERGIRYVQMEAGHAAQNVHLQAVSLGFGSFVIGAFNDNEVKDLLSLEKETPLYVMPIGKIK